MPFQRYLAYSPETAYGTAVAGSSYLDLAGESLKRKSTFRSYRPERLSTPNRQVEAARSVSGAVDVYLSLEALNRVLRYLCSNPTAENLGSGAERYTFLPTPRYTPAGLTVDIAREVEFHRYSGVFFTEGRLSFSNGERHFGLSLACTGKDEASGGAVGTVSDTAFNVPFQVGWDSVGPTPCQLQLYDGSTTWNASFSALDLTWKWDRKPRMIERSLTPVGILGGGLIGATGRFSWFYGTDTDFLLDAIRNRTDVSLTLTMQGNLIGGSIYETLEVYYPVCKINGDPPTLRGSGSGNIDFSVDEEALYSSTIGAPFRIRTTVSAPNLIVNPGDELGLTGGNPTGWTTTSSGWAQYASATGGDPGPQAGTYYFAARFNAASAELYQNVDLTSRATDIDNGLLSGEFSGYYSTLNQDASPPNFSSDTARIILEYRNAGAGVIASFDTGEAQSHGAWSLASDTRVIPALTRSIRLRLITVLYNGTVPNGYFDSFSFRVV